MLRPDQLMARPELIPGLHKAGLGTVAATYAREDGTVITRSKSTEVRRLVLPDGAVVFLKKYWMGNWKRVWNGLFRGAVFGRSKVRREYENLVRLRAVGVNAPEPLAYGEERRGPCLWRSFLLTAAVPEARPITWFIREHLPRLEAEERRLARRELITRLAQWTRHLHDQGFVHHDLFWRNLLLEGASLQRIWVIDAPQGRSSRGAADWSGRVQDLSALDSAAPSFFRASERLRFYLIYAGQSRLSPEDKSRVRQVLRAAAPQRELQQRRVLGARVAF